MALVSRMKKLLLSVIVIASLALLPAMQAAENSPPAGCKCSGGCCPMAKGKAHGEKCACAGCAKAKKAEKKAVKKAAKKAENKAAKKADK